MAYILRGPSASRVSSGVRARAWTWDVRAHDLAQHGEGYVDLRMKGRLRTRALEHKTCGR